MLHRGVNMIVKTVCPQCNNEIDFDDARDFMFCYICGSKINHPNKAAQDAQLSDQAEDKESVPAAQPAPAPAPQPAPAPAPAPQPAPAPALHPNLTIHFASVNPAIGMTVHFYATNQMVYFMTGQQYTANLPAGIHQLLFRIGRREYSRTIFVRDEKSPVTIYASWDGHAHITIDQPPYGPVVPVQPAPAPVYYAAPTPALGAIFCHACGKQLEADASFCTRCGAKVVR